jgi:hypothetical protein
MTEAREESLISDEAFIEKVKEEFVLGNFEKIVKGSI